MPSLEFPKLYFIVEAKIMTLFDMALNEYRGTIKTIINGEDKGTLNKVRFLPFAYTGKYMIDGEGEVSNCLGQATQIRKRIRPGWILCSIGIKNTNMKSCLKKI